MAEMTTWGVGTGVIAYFILSSMILSGFASEKQRTFIEEINYNSSFDYAEMNSSFPLTSETQGLSFMKSLSLTITEDIGWFGNLVFVFLPSLFLILFFVFLIRGIR